VGSVSPFQTTTLTNTGGGSLTGRVAIVGDFRQRYRCAPLSTNQSCTIEVVFTPTQSGVLTGTMTITDNAPDSPQTARYPGLARVAETESRLSTAARPRRRHRVTGGLASGRARGGLELEDKANMRGCPRTPAQAPLASLSFTARFWLTTPSSTKGSRLDGRRFSAYVLRQVAAF
jgi:hypothetical protein